MWLATLCPGNQIAMPFPAMMEYTFKLWANMNPSCLVLLPGVLSQQWETREVWQSQGSDGVAP